MKQQHQFKLAAIALFTIALSACGGDAETIIIERDPIVEPTDPGHGGGDNPGGDIVVDSKGRLAVMLSDTSSVSIMDLDNGSPLDGFSLTDDATSLYASGDYRYAVLSMRGMDTIEFIDGGLWREDHGDHLHDYKQAPAASDFELSGSRPTHIGTFEGQMTVFYDGDADAGIPGAVQVVTDNDIATESNSIPTLHYTVNMHGVAKSRDDILIATIRRDDAQSTSNTKVLPDQVGIYHWHDGEYELEQTLETTCPDLHGAAENHDFVAFGCGDGVLVAHQHNGEFESVKIANIDAIDGMRVGTLYGHNASELFLGIASNRGTGERVLVSINPTANTMEELQWDSQASPIAYAFTYDGHALVILDNEAGVSKYEVHEHDGELEFEFEGTLSASSADLTMMPEGHNFTMTMSQNSDLLYLADPIAQHVVEIDLEDMMMTGDMELNAIPSRIVWLGIAEESDDHGHDH